MNSSEKIKLVIPTEQYRKQIAIAKQQLTGNKKPVHGSKGLVPNSIDE